jgi:hypothetical protein
MRDPLEEDPTEWVRRQDEEVRELRWTAFIEIAQNFAESEGWPGVLAAIARAMKEQQDAAI